MMVAQTTTVGRSGRQVRWLLIGLIGIAIALSVRTALLHTGATEDHSDDTEAITGSVAERLRQTPEDQRTELLLKYLQDPRPGYRFAAVDALETRKGSRVVTALESAFRDNASVVRQRALEVLPAVDPQHGLTLTLAGLKDEDQWIRQAAVQQLLASSKAESLQIADQRVVPALVATLADTDDVVANFAMATLRKITGNPWYVSNKASTTQRATMQAKWQQWWRTEQSKWPAHVWNDIHPVRPERFDRAPAFSLKDVDGRTITLKGQKGRITLLNFWGTWCPPCQQEIPDLEKLSRQFHAQGVDVVGVALSEENGATSLRSFAQKHGLTYRQTLENEAILKDYGDIHEVPVSVLVDQAGRVRYRWEGERDFATFHAAVERLLLEK